MRRPLLAICALGIATCVGIACGDHFTDCEKLGNCPTAGSAGQGAVGAQGGNAGGGADGGGGGDACGGCTEPTPICDESNGTCVACLDHPDCTEADAAKCDGGECVPCDDSAQCAHVPNAEVCDAGACVECTLGEEDACTGGKTCDLVAKACVDVPAHSVDNCEECTNDQQCVSGLRCIPMDFQASFHGYYCLAQPSPMCPRPFQITINKASISEAAPTNYCGIEQNLATCEAVLALVQGLFCSSADGMCSLTQGGPEFAVPGAVCEQVGVAGLLCTYPCGTVPECPQTGPGASCGDGDMSPPGWCGG
jgi:hypothetical protein